MSARRYTTVLFVSLITFASSALALHPRFSDDNRALFSAAEPDTVKVSRLIAYAEELFDSSNLDLSRVYAEQALHLSRSTHDARGAAKSHSLLARVYKWQGPNSKLRLHADSALALYERLNDEVEFAKALRFAVPAHISDWTAQRRREGVDRALVILEKHGLQHEIVECLIEQSRTHAEIESRMRILQSALRIADSIGYERGKHRALSFIAYLYSLQNEFGKGQSLLEQALVIARRRADKLNIADIQSDIADMLIYRNEPDKALEYLDAASATFEAARAKVYTYVALERYGEAYAAKDKMDLARQYWKRSALLAQELFPDQMVRLSVHQAEIAFEKRKHQQRIYQQETEQRKGTFAILSAGAALVLLLLLGVFFRKNKIANLLAAKNATISAQKQQLESQLKELNETTEALKRNFAELDKTKMELHVVNTQLERRVLERTTELYLKNKELKEETTEREQLQRQVSHVQRVESMGTLAGGIAHDFNNILAIVASHASLLATGQSSPEEVQKRTAAILRAGERGAAVVRQLLALSRKGDANKEPVFINDIVIELKQLLAETFPRSVSIDINLDDSIYPFLGEKTLIHQALLNLCLNARDAMPDGGRLAITTEMVGGDLVAERSPDGSFPDGKEMSYVSLCVHDTGIGMDEETQRRVFEPFFTTKGQGKGTGLGLAVTNSAVRSHKGFIHLQSELGKGTSFTLYFPAMQSSYSMEPSHAGFVAEIAGGTETILVAEDEEALLVMLKKGLEEKGYRVLTATNGHDAIDIFHKQRENIDLLLSDIGLPGIDGVCVYKYIRKTAPHVKPIFISGFLDMSPKKHIRELGVEHFIQKPYNMAEVLMRIRHVLNAKRVDAVMPPVG